VKIAVTSTGPTLDDQVDARFGRCACFLIVDPDSMAYETIENPNIAVGGGAGIQSAQLMADKGVRIVLTGNCGPNAFQVFGASGIQVIVGVSGVVRDVITQYKQGAFTASPEANVMSHFGMGVGDAGKGLGVGTNDMGRGMGGGRGMGVGMGGVGGMGGGRGMGGGGGGGGRGRGMGGGGGGGGGGRGRGMGRGMGGGTGPIMEPDMGTEVATPPGGLGSLKALNRTMQERLQNVNERRAALQAMTTLSPLVAVVDTEKCVACGLCVGMCPTGAIDVNEIAHVDGAKCTGCGQCVCDCPQSAISLHKR